MNFKITKRNEKKQKKIKSTLEEQPPPADKELEAFASFLVKEESFSKLVSL